MLVIISGGDEVDYYGLLVIHWWIVSELLI